MSTTISDGTGKGMGRRSTLKAMLAVLMLGLSLGATGCSDDGNDPPPPPPDGGMEEEPTNSAVLVAERVFTPQGQRFYYVGVHANVPTAAIDRSKSIEMTSADIEVYKNRIYIRDRDANTITRYRVTEALALEQVGEKLSFANTGLGTGRYHNVYVSDTLAFTLDAGAWRLIGWNPSTMLLTGQIISIDNMRKQGLATGSIGPAVQVGGRILAPVYWANFMTGSTVYYRGSGAIIIDPTNPTAPAFTEDSRVGGAFRITAGADGAAYMTGVVDAVIGTTFGGGPLPTSGIVRIPDGVNSFDTNYLVDLSDITGSPGVWAVHRIDATTVLAQIFDPAMTPPATPQEWGASTNFIYVTINTQTRVVTTLTNPPRGGRGNAGNHVVDGKLFIQLSNATGSETFAVSGSGITPAFPIPAGDLWHMQRIR